ncbi:unnamed protein product, partial [Meganyctiphanes norvegica]
GKTHLKCKEKEITAITLRQEVDKFLPQIRFLSMSLEEFVKNVLPDTILTLKEVETIQLNIAGVPKVSLPPFVSNKKEKRKFDKSNLKLCNIKPGPRVKSESYSSTIYHPVVLDQVQSTSIIHISKLEYEVTIECIGILTVKDSSGQEITDAVFNGRVAEFAKPLEMLPKEKYSFTITSARSITKKAHVWHLEGNGMISGKMTNGFCESCVLHYWK